MFVSKAERDVERDLRLMSNDSRSALLALEKMSRRATKLHSRIKHRETQRLSNQSRRKNESQIELNVTDSLQTESFSSLEDRLNIPQKSEYPRTSAS